QILLEDYGAKLDDQGKEYLETVRGEAEHMAELIDALLSLSRVTRSEMHRVKVDLSQLAQKVITELRTAEPQRDVSFTVTPAMTVQADPLLMEAVFQNLIGNAWKFTSKCANPVIEVGMIEQEEMDRPGRTVYFVRDNGAGFDMAYAAKLFTPFQRLHHQEEFPGTGVGLATVKRIINRHGGEIWAEAKEDQGATFYFTL
ncbi:MAG TPA: ATP-binding protein, partial [Bacillota bacterium]